ncbi:MAG: hypothetical protein NXI31_24105 [bacterium]|nr:hypothetical protein [bacterium]
MRLLLTLLFLASAIGAQHVVDQLSLRVPKDGLTWEVEHPLTAEDVVLTDIEFEGRRPFPNAGAGASSPAGHTGSYKDSFADDGAMGWALYCSRAENVIGLAQVQGKAEADIESGIGNASAAVAGSALVNYATVTAHATDRQAIAIASAAAPVGVGGQIQLFGFGAGFTITVTPDQPAGQTKVMAKVDTKGWRAGNSATVVFDTVTMGSIALEVAPNGKHCSGSIGGEVSAGAYVGFRP